MNSKSSGISFFCLLPAAFYLPGDRRQLKKWVMGEVRAAFYSIICEI